MTFSSSQGTFFYTHISSATVIHGIGKAPVGFQTTSISEIRAALRKYYSVIDVMLTEVLNVFRWIVIPLSVSFIAVIITFILWALHRNQYWKNLNLLFLAIPFIGTFKDTLLGKTSIYKAFRKVCNNPLVKNLTYYGVASSHSTNQHFSPPNRNSSNESWWKIISTFKIVTRLHTIKPIPSDTTIYSWLRILYRSSSELDWRHFLRPERWKRCSILLNQNQMKYVGTCVVETKQPEIELKEMTACLTTDVIASCAFGVENQSRISTGSSEKLDGNFRFLILPPRLRVTFALHVARDCLYLQLQTLLRRGLWVY